MWKCSSQRQEQNNGRQEGSSGPDSISNAHQVVMRLSSIRPEGHDHWLEGAGAEACCMFLQPSRTRCEALHFLVRWTGVGFSVTRGVLAVE